MIFDWSNFEQFTPHILGQETEPVWIIESAAGRSANYEFSKNSGHGRMEFFEFSRDLRVIVFDCFWTEARTFHVRDGDWVRFNFSLSIDMSMQLSDTKMVNAASPSWRVMNNLPDVDVVETMPANTKAVWVTICCKPEFITQLTGQAVEDMPELLKTAMDDKLHDSFHELFDFTSRLNSITADIIRTDLSGELRVSYVEARSVELLCLALNEIIHLRTGQNKMPLSQADEKALTDARQILLEQFESPPTVLDLSRQVGLNRNKLFYGFKALFSTTISDFIQDQRLERGKQLLQETDLPLLEVANRVGFKHQCNFSTAMKRRYGISPKQLRE